MVKLENIKVYNIEDAMRGMRNPLQSWHKNDTEGNIVGENDKDLSMRLLAAGPEHAKFMRQIFVSFDITAPLYFFKEFDTYKIDTTANSTSTMHTVHKKPFELSDFSFDDSLETRVKQQIVDELERLRGIYNTTKDKEVWRVIIQLLPSAYNQTRTWTGSYANLRNMVQQREGHKLIEWHQFIDQLSDIPMFEEWINNDFKHNKEV